jgi:glycosyltransferase involved in cell wall biosynthesis
LKILHIALGGPEFDRAASDRGHDVYRINWRKMPDPNKEILRCIKGQSFDLVFAQIQTSKVIHHETWDALRESGALVVHWSGDVREDIEWYKDAAPHVDITAFTNMDDVNAIRDAGHRAEYLQIGYDEKIYTYAEKERSGVVFLGNDYGDRFPLSEARAEMVERMKAEFGDQFKAYGKRQDNKATTPAQEVAIYQSALVAINYDHFNRPLFASDRILRAQACGAAVVSMAYEGINDEHPYVGAAESLDDMVKMVRFALDNPERAAALGKMGADHTLSMHRWNNRFETIEQWTS